MTGDKYTHGIDDSQTYVHPWTNRQLGIGGYNITYLEKFPFTAMYVLLRNISMFLFMSFAEMGMVSN